MNAPRTAASALACALSLALGAVPSRAADLAPPELSIARPAGQGQPAMGQAALVQLGTGNRIVLDQSGRHAAAVRQDGQDNSLSLSQSGLDNQASVVQEGVRNQATIEQFGIGNHARIEQYRDDGRARIIQYGDGKRATIIEHHNH